MHLTIDSQLHIDTINDNYYKDMVQQFQIEIE